MIPQIPQPSKRKSIRSRCALAFATLLLFASARAQTVATADTGPIAVSPCDLLTRPMDFDGKFVRLNGTVQAGLDDFLLRADHCAGPLRRDAPAAIWIDLPEGSRSKAGPAIRTTLSTTTPTGAGLPDRPALRLQRTRDFKAFEDALSAPLKAPGLCLGCVSNTVTATLIGRIDAVPAIIWHRKNNHFAEVVGYGNLNAYRVRLVLQEVANPVAHPVDYATAKLALDMPSSTLPAGDPVIVLKSMSEVFPNGSAAHGQLRRAAVALGTDKDHDGVFLRPGAPDEAHAAETAPANATITSSDGFVAYIDYDPARLPTNALARTLALVGTELADAREARSTPTLVDLDGHALQTLTLSAAASGERALTLPGGAVLWQSAWPETTRRQQVSLALIHYLRDWKADIPPAPTPARAPTPPAATTAPPISPEPASPAANTARP